MSFLLGALAVYYLYLSLNNKVDGIDLKNVISTLRNNGFLVACLFVLMILNWGSELIKWNLLLKKVERLSVRELIESLTLGILLSMFTPNRIGELGGRQLHITSENRLVSFYYQSFGAIAQLLTTIVMGLVGAAYYCIWRNFTMLYVWCILGGILILLGLFFFSNSWARILELIKRKFKSLRNQKLMSIHLVDRINTLFLSIVRYCIFCIQFALIFTMFSSYDNYLLIITGLSISFLIAAIVPTNWLSEVAVRSSIIFFVFEELDLESSAAVISTVILWVINLLLPSMLGLFSLHKVNWSSITIRKGE